VESKGLQVVKSGERTNTEGKPVSNRILLSISDTDYNSLRPHLEHISLPNHLVLHEGGGRLEFAYFPNCGLISLVVAMKDGKTAEAGIVGNEGFTGTPSAVGLSRSPLQAVVQITGDGFRIKVAALQDTLQSTSRLQLTLSRYAVVQGMQVAQTAACNRLHDVKQRLARWLLMTQDRVDSASLPITHDFLATMLGTDRPTVSLAAGVLQRKGLIEYTRGAVKIVNRKKLEDSACECYREGFVVRSIEQLASFRSINVLAHCQARDRPNRRNRAVEQELGPDSSLKIGSYFHIYGTTKPPAHPFASIAFAPTELSYQKVACIGLLVYPGPQHCGGEV